MWDFGSTWEVFCRLVEQKESQVEEDHLGFIKGKSAIHLRML